MGAKLKALKMGKDGLIHVALVMGHASYETICGAVLLSTLGHCFEPTCVACISGIVMCGCGGPGELRYCGYDSEIHEQDTPCRCCSGCAKRCYENV